jgi:uncharacterized membrane protein
MPEMIPLGWLHTILGIGALLSGFYTLIKYRVVTLAHRSGRLYVLLTLIVAGTALGIYNQGGFGIAHNLAVLTLVALAGGVVMEKNQAVRLVVTILSGPRLQQHAVVSYDSRHHRFLTTTSGRRPFHRYPRGPLAETIPSRLFSDLCRRHHCAGALAEEIITILIETSH